MGWFAERLAPPGGVQVARETCRQCPCILMSQLEALAVCHGPKGEFVGRPHLAKVRWALHAGVTLIVTAACWSASASATASTSVVEPKDSVAAPVIVSAAQSLAYGFGGPYLNAPSGQPPIVEVNLTLSAVPASGAWVGCSTSNSLPSNNGSPWINLTKTSEYNAGRFPANTPLWCFATSSPIYTEDRSAWSSSFQVTTQGPSGVVTMVLEPAAYDALSSYKSGIGPLWTGCRDGTTNSWRWPLASRWPGQSGVPLPGDVNIPVPQLTSGLAAFLRVSPNGTPALAAATGVGLVDLVTTGNVQVTPTGFTADAFLTTNQFLLSYLPGLAVTPGQRLGTLTLEQTPLPKAPSAPTNLSATVEKQADGKSAFMASWLAPSSDGGSPILGYRYRTTIGNKSTPWVTTRSLTARVVVRSRTQVRFTVVAVNSAGKGPSAVVTVRS